MCEIIGHVTEIVSNQYHLLVLIRKVIALQRLFNFCDYSHSILNMWFLLYEVGLIFLKIQYIVLLFVLYHVLKEK